MEPHFYRPVTVLEKIRIGTALLVSRHFPLSRFRYALARRILRPGSIDVYFDCAFFGYQFHGNLSKNIDWTVFFLGAYEPEALTLLQIAMDVYRDAKGEKPVALDIGANVGHHAMFLARGSKIVHAFEPYPPYFDALKEHARKNRISNLVPHGVGMGSENRVEMYWPDHTPNRTGKFVFVERDNRPGDQIALRVVRGDEYLDEQRIDGIGLIKIDTDGFEGKIFEGLQRTLHRDRPMILSELSAESRIQIPSEDALRSLLYPEVALFNIAPTRWNKTSELLPFDFHSVHDFIGVPQELLQRFLASYAQVYRNRKRYNMALWN